MRLDRENLAVDPKAADVVVGAKLKGSEQCVGILQAQTAQFLQSISPLHLANGGGRGRDELDGLVPKHAAEAKPNHGLPQFIQVTLLLIEWITKAPGEAGNREVEKKVIRCIDSVRRHG